MTKFGMHAALLTAFLFSTAASAMPYSTLTHPVQDAPDVVEFFSFYCPPCYQFTYQYPVVKGINQVLPAGKTVTRYHISAMGKFGHELSEAWAVAIVTGVADRVEHPLFMAVQRDKTLNKPDDIRTVFRKVGISPEEYDNVRHSMMVRALVARQETMASDFRVSSTPSFYVRGRYLIDNSEVKAETPDGYVAAYADLVSLLLKK